MLKARALRNGDLPMRRFGMLLLVCALLVCAACSRTEPSANGPGYETVFPGAAAPIGSPDALPRYTVTPPQLTQAEMEAVMERTALRGGVSFIDTEEQWENGAVVGTRALCSSGLVIRVWNDGTMQLIWPDTLSVDSADGEALARAYYEAYADYLQFDAPVFRRDAAGLSDGCPMVVLDGEPTAEQPFPPCARFLPGDDERGDRLELIFLPGACTDLGPQPLRTAEEAAAQLDADFSAVCLTYGKISGTDTCEPVYVFRISADGAPRTETVSAVKAP